MLKTIQLSQNLRLGQTVSWFLGSLGGVGVETLEHSEISLKVSRCVLSLSFMGGAGLEVDAI